MVRKIVEKIPDEVLQQDLERYRRRALELGATDAKIITTDMILIDDRVLGKCTYPRCPFYGTNVNCPPYAMDLALVRRVVNNFRYAIFNMLKVPSKELAGPEAREKRLSVPSAIKNHKIVARIEAEAFYDGYHLALAFAGGPCKNIFCPNTECSALVSGQSCKHFPMARSSMEAVGMDTFTMAAKVGWDIYPIGRSLPPSEVPHGTRLGLVLIY
jgi:predicted metal-binding protein